MYYVNHIVRPITPNIQKRKIENTAARFVDIRRTLGNALNSTWFRLLAGKFWQQISLHEGKYR